VDASPRGRGNRLAVEDIVALARDYGTRRPAVIRTSMGLQRHSNGGATLRALACLPALTGDYGKQGGGLLYSTGGYWMWPGPPLPAGAGAEQPEPPARAW
jgi:anaerobic selenocysteine-containing dehydrogenase